MDSSPGDSFLVPVQLEIYRCYHHCDLCSFVAVLHCCTVVSTGGYQHQVCHFVQAVQPKLEAMEAAWYRLHSISGAATPDQVIAYWEGALSALKCVLILEPTIANHYSYI